MSASMFGTTAVPTGPWLNTVYHAHACKRYYGLMRQSDGPRPAWAYRLLQSAFALAGCPPHLPFFVFDKLSAHATTSTPPADLVPLMAHPQVIEAFVHSVGLGSFLPGCPLTGFGGGRISRRQYSRHVAACAVARASWPVPADFRRQARPFTAELAPGWVSPSQSLL